MQHFLCVGRTQLNLTHCQYSVNILMFSSQRNRATRGHNFKLFIPESGVVDCRKRFFAVRINLMPDDVVSADSLSLFVGRLGVDLGGFLVGRS